MWCRFLKQKLQTSSNLEEYVKETCLWIRIIFSNGLQWKKDIHNQINYLWKEKLQSNVMIWEMNTGKMLIVNMGRIHLRRFMIFTSQYWFISSQILDLQLTQSNGWPDASLFSWFCLTKKREQGKGFLGFGCRLG